MPGADDEDGVGKMRKTILGLGAMAVLTACDDAILVGIPGTEPYEMAQAELAAWDAAVASVGCVMAAEAQYHPVEIQTGLSRERVSEILGRKIAAGEAVERPEGGYRYVSGSCTPAATPAPESQAPAVDAT